MLKNISISFILIICHFALNAQHSNVMISNKSFPEEPSIMINPKNLNQLVAGANINSYFYSDDGGLTWTGDTLRSELYGVWGDPCIIVDTNGYFYFFHLSNPPTGSWIDRIVCQRSTDGGQTWNDGTYAGKNGAKMQDKEWAIVDRNTNAIYMTWTQFDDYASININDSSTILFSKSLDAGQTWSTAKRINKIAGDCIDGDTTVEGAVPAVGPNGEIYVAWSSLAGIIFDRSTDGGDTWLDSDIFVADQPGGWNFNVPGISRCNGLPVTICDISNGPYRGNIYVNWTDQRNNTSDTDVWLSKSTDGGNTWSSAKKVNDDNSGKHQFFTWMDVDQVTGYLYFVFYDRRNDNNDVNLTAVYMAVSKDGGETFVNFKISDFPFIPDDNVFFGDYTNITAHNGVVRPIWTRLDYNVLSIWTAIIDQNHLGVDNIEPLAFKLNQNYPNPFQDMTYFSYKLHAPTTISLKVYDLYGREIATIVDNELKQTGKYVEQFDALQHNLTPGIYTFSLICNEKNLVKKMIIIE